MTERVPDVDACRERALLLLGQRPHSVVELTRKLSRKAFSRDAIEQVVNDFCRVNLLDDHEFAVAFCTERLGGSRPLGRFRLRAELRRRGVDEEVSARAIKEALEERGGDAERELAREAGETKWRQLQRRGKDDRFRTKHKVCQFLARRGFPGDLCRRVADELDRDIDDVGADGDRWT